MKGLEKWRQELEGKAHFEMARALARATYRMRDEIQSFRSPFYSAQEFPEGYTGSAGITVDEETKAWAHIYRSRWAPVWSALRNFRFRK